MNDEFYKKLVKGYDEDPEQVKLIKIIDNPKDETTPKLPFVRGRNLPPMDYDPYFGPRPEDDTVPDQPTDIHPDLIYYVNKYTGHYRICVPNYNTLVKDILQVTYGSNGHPGYKKCFKSISRVWYVRHLGRHLRDFLKYCPECRVF